MELCPTIVNQWANTVKHPIGRHTLLALVILRQHLY